MRKLRIPLILGALLCCLLAFTACGRVRLARPAGLLIDSDTLELTWYEVSEADRYTLEIPAGALDAEDEPGIDCASRELEEETGYRSDNLEWLITLRTTVAFCNERIEVYVAKNLIPSKQHLDEDEFIDLKAYSLDELKQKIFAGEIEDAKTVASLMAYAVKYQE